MNPGLRITRSQVDDILAGRLDREHDGRSLIVGIVSAERRDIVARTAEDVSDAAAPRGDAIFEIGSNTKVFTSLLLAEMAGRGEVKLDEPAAAFLPSDARLPERAGAPITLRHLASHTSGLLRDADDYGARDPANPFADFSVERLYDFLGRYRLDRAPGAAWAYSNVGAGLLGHVLARRAGRTFEALVRDRISSPLGLADTTITLSPAQTMRAAPGHDLSGRPTPWLDLPAIPGAGALRSAADDLLTFLGAVVGLTETPLGVPMRAQLADRRPSGRSADEQQALGWLVSEVDGREIAWHVGRTMGGHGFIGADLARRIGVVVLGNRSALRAGDDIGFHILAGRPLAAPPATRRAVRLAPAHLERLAGRYRLSATVDLLVTRDAGHLRVDIGGRASQAFVPESETTFFLRRFDVQITSSWTPMALPRPS